MIKILKRKITLLKTQPRNGSGYGYLYEMPFASVSQERRNALLKQRDAKQAELDDLKKKTLIDLWTSDLNNLLKELDVR